LKLFGEEPQSVQPDEFFGIFELFLVSFADARLDNERLQRLKAEEEKRQKMEAQVSGMTALTALHAIQQVAQLMQRDCAMRVLLLFFRKGHNFYTLLFSSIESSFIHKPLNSCSCAILWGLRGNVHTLS